MFALIFAFGKQGSWGGMFDRFLVDGQGRKLVTEKSNSQIIENNCLLE